MSDVYLDADDFTQDECTGSKNNVGLLNRRVQEGERRSRPELHRYEPLNLNLPVGGVSGCARDRQQDSNQHRPQPHRAYRRNVFRNALANGDTLTSPAVRLNPLVNPALLASRINVRPRLGIITTIEDEALPEPNCHTTSSPL